MNKNKPKTTNYCSEEAAALVREYKPFVRIIAYKYSNKLPSSMEMEDLMSVGCIGLLEAATRYDSSLGVPFKQFAAFRIRGAMLDEIRRHDFLPRRVRQQFKKMLSEIDRVEKTKGEHPSSLELANSMNISREKVEELRNRPLFISCSDSEKTDYILRNSLPEEPGSPQTDPCEFTVFQNIQFIIAEALAHMSDREQTLIQMYYFEDKGLKEIGLHLGLSESRISQMRTQGLAQLKKVLMSSLAANEAEELLAA